MPRRPTHPRTCHRHRAPPSCARPSWWRPRASLTTGRRRPKSGWAQSASARWCSAARRATGGSQEDAPRTGLHRRLHRCLLSATLPAHAHAPHRRERQRRSRCRTSSSAACGTCCLRATRACGALVPSWRACATSWSATRATGGGGQERACVLRGQGAHGGSRTPGKALQSATQHACVVFNPAGLTPNAPTRLHLRRLKSAGGNKTIEGLLATGCERRVVLTGTPVQNDLMVRRGDKPQAPAACDPTQHAAQSASMGAWLTKPTCTAQLARPPSAAPPAADCSRLPQEFYALLSFATPGVLGQMGTFKRVYAGVCGALTAAASLQPCLRRLLPPGLRAAADCMPPQCTPPIAIPHVPSPRLRRPHLPLAGQGRNARREGAGRSARNVRARAASQVGLSVRLVRVQAPQHLLHAHPRLACPQRGKSCPSTSPRPPLPRFPHLAASCSSRRAPLSCGAPRTS